MYWSNPHPYIGSFEQHTSSGFLPDDIAYGNSLRRLPSTFFASTFLFNAHCHPPKILLPQKISRQLVGKANSEFFSSPSPPPVSSSYQVAVSAGSACVKRISIRRDTLIDASFAVQSCGRTARQQKDADISSYLREVSNSSARNSCSSRLTDGLSNRGWFVLPSIEWTH